MARVLHEPDSDVARHLLPRLTTHMVGIVAAAQSECFPMQHPSFNEMWAFIAEADGTNTRATVDTVGLQTISTVRDCVCCSRPDYASVVIVHKASYLSKHSPLEDGGI